GGGSSSGGGGVQVWVEQPLQRQLAGLAEQCRAAFGHLQREVSPSLQLVARVPLLPPPHPSHSPAAAGMHGCCCMSLPQSRSEPHCPRGQSALLACMLQGGTLPAGMGAGAGAGAAGNNGGEVVLLMRLTAVQQQQQWGNQMPSKRTEVHACLLQLPEGQQVLGAVFYRSAQLALLLGPTPQEQGHRGNGVEGKDDSGGLKGSGSGVDAVRAAVVACHEGSCPMGGVLALLPTAQLEMCTVDEAEVQAFSIAQVCADRGAITFWPVPGCRLRRPPRGSGCWQAPLLVSGPRGLAAAFTEGSRAFMIDLEE
ncbi:hypothetical protein Agub_g3064, partial [Astrephomene gubernaculifera]